MTTAKIAKITAKEIIEKITSDTLDDSRKKSKLKALLQTGTTNRTMLILRITMSCK